ncbi:MAG: NUDIX hydrolase [Frankia sp.]
MAAPETSFPPFAVTADLVVLTVRDGGLCVLLVSRGIEPYLGRGALPGGFVHPDEDLDHAARRELREETGIEADIGPDRDDDRPGPPVHLEQLASYGAPDRDPRMRVVTVAYLGLAPNLPAPVAGSDAAASTWTPVDPLLADPRRLAFDHGAILRDGVERARAKLEYSPLATAFCGPEFTVGELRRVYEAVWGVALDPRNFHRKVTGTPGFLLGTGRTSARDGGRPAELFRPGPATRLHPAMLRPTGPTPHFPKSARR